MFQKMFHGVFIGPPHPIGQILNYDVKKEFQGQGRVHFHVTLHVKDAPKLEENTAEELGEFIEKHIPCQIPNENEDKELHELVTVSKTLPLKNM